MDPKDPRVFKVRKENRGKTGCLGYRVQWDPLDHPGRRMHLILILVGNRDPFTRISGRASTPVWDALAAQDPKVTAA